MATESLQQLEIVAPDGTRTFFNPENVREEDTQLLMLIVAKLSSIGGGGSSPSETSFQDVWGIDSATQNVIYRRVERNASGVYSVSYHVEGGAVYVPVGKFLPDTTILTSTETTESKYICVIDDSSIRRGDIIKHKRIFSAYAILPNQLLYEIWINETQSTIIAAGTPVTFPFTRTDCITNIGNAGESRRFIMDGSDIPTETTSTISFEPNTVFSLMIVANGEVELIMKGSDLSSSINISSGASNATTNILSKQVETYTFENLNKSSIYIKYISGINTLIFQTPCVS